MLPALLGSDKPRLGALLSLLLLLMVLTSLTLPGVHCALHRITENCTELTPWSCNTSSGIIDLSPLSNNNASWPYFYDQDAEVNADLFSFDPYTPFNEQDCVNASVCQIQGGNHGFCFATGNQTHIDFRLNYSDKCTSVTGLVMWYHFPGSNERQSIILLTCDPEGNETSSEFKVYGEMFKAYFPGKYYFELISKYACPNDSAALEEIHSVDNPFISNCTYNPTTTPTTTTVTTTTVTTPTTHTTVPTLPPPVFVLTPLIIALLVLFSLITIFLMYCIIGMAVNLIRGRRGHRVVPNHTLWGRVFCCCKNRPYSRCSCCRSSDRQGAKPILTEEEQYFDH